MAEFAWRGVFPALTTPFTADDRVDFEALGALVDFQLEAGVHGLIVLGSLGENATLEAGEKRDIVAFCRERIGDRAPLVACVAESSTRAGCDRAREAFEAGAEGLMVLPPMRYAPDARESHAYLRAVADATPLPVMLYNNPVAYGTDLRPADFEALADEPRFVAIKESSADTRRIPDIRRRLGERYALFCGVDDLAYECFGLGAVGWVAGLVVAFPRETVRLYELCTAGRWDEARQLYEWFLPLLHLDIGPRFVQQIKLVEEILGVGSARVRKPRLPLPAAKRAQIESLVREVMAGRPAALAP